MSVAATKNRPASEWRLIGRDKWLLALVSWLPPMLFLLMYAIFAQGLPRDLAIGVVDLDNSRISRMIVRGYDASPTLKVTKSYTSASEGIADLRGGEIYGLVVIEPDTERDVTLGKAPVVNSFYNSQYLLIGKLVKSALSEAHGTVAAQVEVVKNLQSGTPEVGEALAAAVPVSTQITPLYNINRNYAQFLGSAIIPALWQIFIVMATVYSMAAELRSQGKAGLPVWLGRRPVKALVRKMAPYTLIFWLHGLVFLLGMFVFAQWPMHGSLAYLACAQFLAVCGCQAMGALLFFLTRDAARGLSMAAAYAAPGLAFMGVTFPVTDMIYPAQVWRSLLPVSHYIDIQISQANYGASLAATWPQFTALLLFTVPALVVVLLAYRFRMRDDVGVAA